MIIGAHSIIYSKDPDADRAFFRDVLKFPYVDAHDGWLIFGLPPSEVACHPLMSEDPSTENGKHEFFLMCEDVTAFVAEMKSQDVPCTEPADQGWGILTSITLPGGSKLGVYQARHARPEAMK